MTIFTTRDELHTYQFRTLQQDMVCLEPVPYVRAPAADAGAVSGVVWHDVDVRRMR
jgi:hypothetical protein